MPGLTAPDAATLPAGRPRSRVALLTRHFFRRFLENDLISPGGDAHVGLSHIIGAFVTPGLLVVVLVMLKYALVHTTWARVIALGVDDALLYVALSMIVLGIAATITWDAFFLDARDHVVLGVLPVSHRLMALAKLGALGMFLGIFAGAANVVPTALVPLLMLQRVGDATWLHHFWPLTAAHGTATLLSGAWAVLAVVALRGALAALLPPSGLRRAAPLVQGVLVLVLLAWFVSLPEFLASRPGLMAGDGPWLYASPPMWFLGLYETMIGQPNPVYHVLARTALWSTGVMAAVVVLLLFGLPAGRASGGGSAVVVSGRRRLGSAAVRRLSEALFARPRARASLRFTMAVLGRSATHRVYLAAALGGGLAWSLSGVFWLYTRSGPAGLHMPDLATLAVQPTLVLFLVAAMRFAVNVPQTLPANWVIRVTEGPTVAPDHAGVRAAAFTVGALVVLALVPAHLAIWTWDVALYHAGVGLIYTAFIVALFYGAQTKYPFAAPYISGSLKLKSRWLVYLFGLSALTAIPSVLESQALRYGRDAVLLPVGLLAATLALGNWRRRREREIRGHVFDDLPEDAVQGLELFY
jgi:hypothetical protein